VGENPRVGASARIVDVAAFDDSSEASTYLDATVIVYPFTFSILILSTIFAIYELLYTGATPSGKVAVEDAHIIAVFYENSVEFTAFDGEVFKDDVFGAFQHDSGFLCIGVAKCAFNDPAFRSSVFYPCVGSTLFSDDNAVSGNIRKRAQVNGFGNTRSAGPCAKSGLRNDSVIISGENSDLILGILVEIEEAALVNFFRLVADRSVSCKPTGFV